MPPQSVHWFDGGRFRPHVYAVKGARDLQTFKRVYQVDPGQKIPIRFFAQGFEYRFLGVIPMTRHLIGVDEGLDATKTIFLLGTDVQGRDLWSRLMYGTRISLTIGLCGVTLSLLLGVVLGGLSGFYGGIPHTPIHRGLATPPSIPTIPPWMGPAPARDQLGRPAAAGPERPDGGHHPVADDPGRARDHRRHGLQLPGRWTAGRRRSLWTLGPRRRHCCPFGI